MPAMLCTIMYGRKNIDGRRDKVDKIDQARVTNEFIDFCALL